MTRESVNLTRTPPARPGGLNHCRERPDVPITPSYVRNLPLVERDRHIVRYLGEIGYATTRQLARLFWPGRLVGTASRRLLKLWRLWVLDRQPCHRLPDFGLRAQLVYMPGRAGVKMLRDVDENARRPSGTLLMAHNVLLGEAVVRLTEGARRRGPGCGLSFCGEGAVGTAFKWNDDWVRMRPDGLISFQIEGREMPFYVEFDRDTRPVSHFAAKARVYELYRRTDHWRRRHATFPGVLVVVWTDYHAEEGESPEETAGHRRQMAADRLERIIEQLAGATRHRGLGWFCQRLDLVGQAPWRVVTADGLRQAPPFFTAAEDDRGDRAGGPPAGTGISTENAG